MLLSYGKEMVIYHRDSRELDRDSHMRSQCSIIEPKVGNKIEARSFGVVVNAYVMAERDAKG